MHSAFFHGVRISKECSQVIYSQWCDSISQWAAVAQQQQQWTAQSSKWNGAKLLVGIILTRRPISVRRVGPFFRDLTLHGSWRRLKVTPAALMRPYEKLHESFTPDIIKHVCYSCLHCIWCHILNPAENRPSVEGHHLMDKDQITCAHKDFDTNPTSASQLFRCLDRSSIYKWKRKGDKIPKRPEFSRETTTLVHTVFDRYRISQWFKIVWSKV